MMHPACSALIFALTISAGAAMAAASDRPPATETAKPDRQPANPRLDDRTVVCKHEESTGSRLGGFRVCLTRAEWAARAAAAHEQMDRIQQTPQTH